jgi:hypothetical protein
MVGQSVSASRSRAFRGASTGSWFAILVAVTSVTACAIANVANWTGRDIEELIRAVGPYDLSVIRGDLRTYTWHRRGTCRLDARASLDERIVTIETMGTSQGCSVYLEKMGGG